MSASADEHGNFETKHNRAETTCVRIKKKVQTIEMFTLVATLVTNNTGMFWYAMSGVIASMQRLFHFDSATIGRLLMAPELGPLGGLLLISHFSNRFNMSYITGVTAIIYCIGIFLVTLPHYVLDIDDMYAHTADDNLTLLCVPGEHSADSGSEEHVTTNTVAFGIMFAALFLLGVSAYPAYTLPYSILESNTKKSQTALYVAILNLGWATAPIFGLLLSAGCMSLYVNLTETSLTPEDPTWIGAWWLALIIVSILGFVPSLFLFLCPKDYKTRTQQHLQSNNQHDGGTELEKMMLQDAKKLEKEAEKKLYSWKVSIAVLLIYAGMVRVPVSNMVWAVLLIAYECKGFVKKWLLFRLILSLKRLLTNPVYIAMVFGYVFWAQFGWGFASFFPMFYSQMFKMTGWQASIAAGLVIGIGMLVGRLASGLISSLFKLSLRTNHISCIVLTIVSTLCLVINVFLNCEPPTLIGAPGDNGDFIINQACAVGCDCSSIPYTPICDAGLTYFSPCHAGCLDNNITMEFEKTIYSACNCTATGTAVGGECQTECHMFIPYTIVTVIVMMSMAYTNPLVIVFTMRCVDPEDKTLAYGLCMFVIGLLGWLPAPSLFGSVIDTACAVWEDQGGGTRGSCWVYDTEALGRRVQGLSAGIRALQALCYIIVYILGRRKFEIWEKLHQDQDDN